MTAAGTVRGEWAVLSFTARAPPARWRISRRSVPIGGFVAYTYALRHLPVSFVSLYAYINPVIAVTLGVLLLGEPFNSRMAAARRCSCSRGSRSCASRRAAARRRRRGGDRRGKRIA